MGDVVNILLAAFTFPENFSLHPTGWVNLGDQGNFFLTIPFQWEVEPMSWPEHLDGSDKGVGWGGGLGGVG